MLSFPTTQTKSHPRLTQEGEDRESDPGQYIANLRDGALVGFKYFDFETEKPGSITVRLRGRAKGVLYVYDEAKREMPAAAIPVEVNKKEWTDVTAPLRARGKKAPLFFLYRGSGALDLFSFRLE